ncbi:MAG: hypothetical protein JNK23_10565 [Opitutaceae bacterium]|nr:hypothetical protein [Opitutaceae bacterium]
MNDLPVHLLLALNGAGAHGLPVATLLVDLRRGGHHTLSEPQLVAALRGLADQSHAVSFGSALGQQRWRITSRGKSALHEEGLA